METANEFEWLSYLETFPVWKPQLRPMLIVSPHPDDEVLGVGGLIASHVQQKLPVKVVAVTDGEAAYPDVPNLAAVRQMEQENALARLGLRSGRMIRLGFPDGDVASREVRLAENLASLLNSDWYVVAPWTRDPHPDHEACGRAAEQAAKSSGAILISYFFWTWNRWGPNSVDGLPFRRFVLSAELQMKKAVALSEYRSQLLCGNREPILPPQFLAPALRPFESVVVHEY